MTRARRWPAALCAALLFLAARPLARPRGGLGEEMWQRALYHPREDRRLSRLFGAVSTTVTLMRAKEARAFGLDERRRVPDDDGSLLSQLVTYACGLLGVPRPTIHVEPKRNGFELMNVMDQARLMPALAASRTTVSACSGGTTTRTAPTGSGNSASDRYHRSPSTRSA